MAEAYELSSNEPRSNNNNECNNASEHQTLHDGLTQAQQQHQKMYYQQSTGQPHPLNQNQISHMNERPMEIPAAKVRNSIHIHIVCMYGSSLAPRYTFSY